MQGFDAYTATLPARHARRGIAWIGRKPSLFAVQAPGSARNRKPKAVEKKIGIPKKNKVDVRARRAQRSTSLSGMRYCLGSAAYLKETKHYYRGLS